MVENMIKLDAESKTQQIELSKTKKEMVKLQKDLEVLFCFSFLCK